MAGIIFYSPVKLDEYSTMLLDKYNALYEQFQSIRLDLFELLQQYKAECKSEPWYKRWLHDYSSIDDALGDTNSQNRVSILIEYPGFIQLCTEYNECINELEDIKKAQKQIFALGDDHPYPVFIETEFRS